jgi:hypothetical protein
MSLYPLRKPEWGLLCPKAAKPPLILIMGHNWYLRVTQNIKALVTALTPPGM